MIEVFKPSPPSKARLGPLQLPFQRDPAPEALLASTERISLADACDEAAVWAFARVRGVEPGDVFLAAWAIWLHRMGEQADVTLGLVGFGAAPVVPVAVAVGGLSVGEVVARCREATAEARSTEQAIAYPLTAGFVHGPATPPPTGLALALAFSADGERLRLTLHVDAGAFARPTAERFAEGFATLLSAMLHQPHAPIDTLTLVGPRERHRLLEAWAGPSPEGGFKFTHERLEAWAVETPQAPALSYGGETWSYASVNERANRLARHLQAKGIGPGALVALHLPRSFDMPLAMLALAKTGAAYVALEPSLPEARAAALLDTLGHPVLLARHAPAASLAERASAVFVLDDMAEALAACSGDNLGESIPDGAIAAIYLTSGTSGEPKPVVYTHQAFGRAAHASAEAYGFSPQGVFLYAAPYSFIASLAIFVALGSGMHLALANTEVATNPLATFELIRSAGITHMFMVPTFWRASMQALDALEPEARARLLDNDLQVYITGGEAVTPDVVARWRERFSANTRVLNGYGQTETTTVTNYVVPQGLPDMPAVSVGRPIRGCAIYLLNERMEPVPIGTAGMVFAHSAHMASGYWGQTDTVDEKMVPNPFGPGRLCKTGDLGRFDEAGNLYVIGRIDQMLKIRGQRVEPGEIEMRLRAHPALRDAVVVGRTDDQGASSLVAFLVAEAGTSLSVAALRAHLSQTLTSAMVPAAFVYLPALPTNANGKIDLARLRAMPLEGARATADRVEPRNDVETRLLGIWEEVLGFSGFGVTDSFFELGGDSLRAVHVLAHIERAFDLRLASAVFAASPTVEALALAIARGESDEADAYVVPLRTGGTQPPLILFPPIGGSPETYLSIARLLPAEQPVFAGHLVGTQHPIDFNASLPQLASIYVKQLQRDFPKRPLRLGGYSSGGGMAFEVARQLEAEGHEVERLIVLDTDITHLGLGVGWSEGAEAGRVPKWRATARLLLRAWQMGYGYRYPSLLPGLLGLKDRLLGVQTERGDGPESEAIGQEAQQPAQPPATATGMAAMSFAGLLGRLDQAVPVLLPGGRKALRRLIVTFPRVPLDQRRARLFEFSSRYTQEWARPELPPGQRHKVARSSFILSEALEDYRPAGQIHAAVILLKAQDGQPGQSSELGWGLFAAREFMCVSVPGDHHSMMRSPHLELAVERLWSAMSGAAPLS